MYFVRSPSDKSSITAYLAALVTVGALGFEPFVQQLLTTQYRVVPVASSGIYINSTSSITVDIFAAFDYPETDIQITAAMLADVQQEPQAPNGEAAQVLDRRATSQLSNANATSQSSTSPLKATCLSGNCVWPNYYTLDICARCQNITKTTSMKNLSPDAANLAEIVSVARQNKQNGSAVSASSFVWEIVPRNGNSVRVNSSVSAFVDSETESGEPDGLEYSGYLVHKIVWPLNVVGFVDDIFDTTGWTPQSFAGVEGPVVALGYAEFGFNPNTGQPFLNNSLECALTYCVSEYNRSVVEGNLVSNILSTQYGAVSGNPGTTENLSWSAKVNGTDFTVDSFLMYGSGVGTLVQRMVGQTNYVFGGHCLASNDWSCDDTPVYSDSNYSSVQWEGIDLTADFSVVVENANAIVSEIVQQYGNISVAGQNSTTKSFVIVRWPWIALPLAVVLLGMLTLGLTVWETNRLEAPLWKSSLLPLIYRYKHDDDDLQQQKPSSPGQAAAQPQILLKGSDPQSDLVSRFKVQAETTLASLSKDEPAQGVWMLQSI